MNKRPLLCRLGFHSWYRDGAMFTHADRCNHCDRWRDVEQGWLVDKEREAWETRPANESFKEGQVRVAEYISRLRSP